MYAQITEVVRTDVGAVMSAVGPLAGLQVIEVSSFVAAPLGGMTLAQLGADVIRIDPIGGAADVDRWPLTEDGTSLYWAGLNKGKKSLMANLREPAGQQLVIDLIKACPPKSAVLLTNAAGQEWLSYSALREVVPDLIHVQVLGSPDGTSAVDYTVNAAMGFPLVTGAPESAAPVNHVLPAWDIACGLYCALGVAAAARQRELTGAGSEIRLALSDIALAMAGNLGFLAEAQINKVQRPRYGNYLYGSFARDFECRDGRVMVVALTARHWKDLIKLCNVQDAVAGLETALNVDFSSESTRFEYREVLAGLIQHWFARQSMAQASELLAKTSVLWAPYRSFVEVVADIVEHDNHNPMISSINQAGVGDYLAPGSPITFSEFRGEAIPAPVLGSDSVSLLQEKLGKSPAEIEQLLTAGLVAKSRSAGRSSQPPGKAERA